MVVKLSPSKGLDKKAKKASMSAESLLKGFSFGKNCSVNITLNTSE